MPKPICADCVNYINSVCAVKSKNNYNDCKKFKPIPIDQVRKELNQLYVSGKDPKCLAELKAKIEYFDYGVVK